MREHKLDALIVPGGPSHWSFGGGMLWLTGHWEWHALSSYVVVPLEGEPTLIYSMAAPMPKRCAAKSRSLSRTSATAATGAMRISWVERLRELKLERGRIGLIIKRSACDSEIGRVWKLTPHRKSRRPFAEWSAGIRLLTRLRMSPTKVATQASRAT
jgi:hypothetical protein